MQLSSEANRFAELRRRIVAFNPTLDAETLNDTLEGATNFKEALGSVIRSAIMDEKLVHALGERLSEMRTRMERIRQRAEGKRSLVLQAMQETSLQRIVEPDFTASIRRTTPKAIIVSDAEIPDRYWIPQPAKLDKSALTHALRGGEHVPGAILENSSSTLSIRVG